MTTLFEAGDAIRGDRIAVNARRLGPSRVVSRSGRHNAQELVAKDEVYCVIEMPLSVRPKGQAAP
jgi:hypothetical protein